MGGTPDYNESVAMNLSFYMAAKMSPGEVRSGREFTVGDGLYYGGYYNAPLVPESTYSVGLAAEVDFEGTKCEKYWPEKTAIYGEIQVHFIAEEQFPDYVIHQLHITLADTTREVKHFHLTSWPDHGVPLYPNTVLTFRRKVNQYRTYNEAPVVVHCSAGIGRTGTYILLDNLLEQSQSEGVVDVVGQLSAMRQNRMNVVETLEQYNFVHRALMESVCIRDHSVPCSKMYDRYTELLSLDETTGKSAIVKEFE
ncbi:hypothetical protein V5799_022324, partial [Amblyomma americanum]